MSQDKAIVLIVLGLIIVLCFSVIFDRSEHAQTIVGEITKIAVSGYIGYLHGSNTK